MGWTKGMNISEKLETNLNKVKNMEKYRQAKICQNCDMNREGRCFQQGKWCSDAIRICYKRNQQY